MNPPEITREDEFNKMLPCLGVPEDA
jgi:hypothetical protein